MDRRNWLKRIGVAAVGLTSFVLLAGFGRGGHGCGHHGGPEGMERMLGAHLEDVLEDIDATPEQRQKIVAVKDRLLEKGKALHGSRREGVREMLQQWESPTVDTAKVHARIDERAEQMKAFAHETADALAEVHSILTPAQREKVARKWKRRMPE